MPPPFRYAIHHYLGKVRISRAAAARVGLTWILQTRTMPARAGGASRCDLCAALAATRSLVLPFKALVMNVLTFSAASGVLVFVFQDGRLEGLLRYQSQGALELTQPVCSSRSRSGSRPTTASSC